MTVSHSQRETKVTILSLLALFAVAQTPATASAGSAPACEVDAKAPPRSVSVTWSGPDGQPVSAIKARLTYDQRQIIPDVKDGRLEASLSKTPEGAIVVAKQLADGVEVVISKSPALPADVLFTVPFRTCAGADGSLDPIRCAVADCGSSYGAVKGCSCTAR